MQIRFVITKHFVQRRYFLNLIEIITTAPEGIDESSRLLQSNLTVVTFKLRRTIDSGWCNVEELRQIHVNLMDENISQVLVHLGQPVPLTSDNSLGALRLAFGGIMMQQLNRIVEDSGSMDAARIELGIWLETAKKALLGQLTKE